MATLTSTPSISPSSLSISGTTSKTATISWTRPTVPSDGTITSCILTGTATASMSKGSATITVNGTTVTSGAQFSINLGTANTTTSVEVTAKGGNKNASGTVTFSNLVYTVTYEEPKVYYTVTFVDWDGTTLKTQTVEEGSSAIAPSNPTREGYTFTGWDVNYSNITSNLTVAAQYTIATYTVTFVDWDGTVLKTENVEHGSSATAPSNPTRDGYIFTGWNKSYTNVTSNLTITALYEIDSSTIVPITSIELDETNIVAEIGMAKQIRANVNPSNANEKVKWQINNSDISLSINNKVPDDTLVLYGKELKPELKNCTVVQTYNSFELTSFTNSNAAVTYTVTGLNSGEIYTLAMDNTPNIVIEIYHGETYTVGNTSTPITLTGYGSYTLVFYNDNGTTSNWGVTNISLTDSIGNDNFPNYDGLTAFIVGNVEGSGVLTCSNQDGTILDTCNITVKYTPDNELGTRRGLFSWHYNDFLECDTLARACNVLNLNEIYQAIDYMDNLTDELRDELSDCIYNIKKTTKHNVEIVLLDGDAQWYSDPEPMMNIIDNVVSFNNSNKNNVKINRIMFDVEPWSAGITGWYPVYQETMLDVYEYCKANNLELELCVPFWLDNGIDPSIVTDFHKIVIDLCDAYVCMNYNKNGYLTNMDVEMEYARSEGKYIYSAAECQPVSEQYGVTEDLTYYYDGIDLLYAHWRNIYNRYDYDKLGFAIHDFNNAIKQWTSEVDITEKPISSVTFKENAVSVNLDETSTYKLEYSWQPLNADKDFRIVISDESVASFDYMTDEITIKSPSVFNVTIISNNNDTVYDIITITATSDVIVPTSNLRVKENGSWVTIKNIYKKMSGTWILQTISESLFNTHTIYKMNTFIPEEPVDPPIEPPVEPEEPIGELSYYGEATSLATAKYSLAATTVGDYALFGGGTSGNKHSAEVDAYDTNLTKTMATSLSQARYLLAATTIGDYALFGGGTNGSSQYNTVDAYNTSLTRTTPTALSQNRSGLTATTIGDYALFGAGTSGSMSSVVDAYDASLTRTTPTELSVARNRAAATTVGNYALFGGGMVGSGVYSSTVDAYDTSLTRTTVTELSQERFLLAATTVGDYALFGGGSIGSASLTTVDAYNTSLTRTLPTELTKTVSNLAATTVSNYALFAGGSGAGSSYNSVDAYDRNLTKTSTVTLNATKYGLSATTINNYALFGGGYTTKYSAAVDVVQVL